MSSSTDENPAAAPVPGASPEPGHPIALPHFRNLWIGLTISVLGDQFYLVALPWLVLQLTGSGLALGTILMTAAIPRAALMLVGGAVIDRFSARRVVMFTATTRGLLVGTVALLISRGVIQLWHLYLLTFAFGIADAFSFPAGMTLIPTLVEPRQLGPANAMLQSSTVVAQMVGPAPAGLVIRRWGTAAALFFDALSFLAVLVAIVRLPVPPKAELPAAGAPARPSMLNAIAEGVRAVWHDPPLLSLMGVFAAINLCVAGPIGVGLPVMAKLHFGSAAAFGTFLSCFGGGTLAGVVLAGTLKRSRKLGLQMLVMGALTGLELIAIGLVLKAAVIATLMAAMGIGVGFVNVQFGAWIQARVARALMGRVASVLMFCVAALRSENVVLIVQPPRGFGENPVAIYHDPDLPPSHHYLAAYRWIEAEFGADAVVHLGKHGNLEWLPGKTLGMSAACGSDAALGNLPLIYPFLVNDPGEGTQAKRRAHATLIDHLIPPMARAETYGDIARLEQLLDEHAAIAALDPGKLPAIRQQIWTLMRAAKMDHDLGLAERPEDDSFDDMLLHVDGWLCEIKDVQIRDGLHILGEKPTDGAELNLVLAILRARQLFGGEQTVPGLRQALGLSEDGNDERAEVDVAEAQARDLVAALQETGWDPTAADSLTDDPVVADILRFAAAEVVPRLAETAGEIRQILRALEGRFIASGPSGSPLRGLVNVLPTGRNFYSVDPKAVPSRLAWETGVAMADSLLARYRTDYGHWPQSVGLSVWGTSAMRTAGDDIAEVLALLGVRPVWDDASRRVVDLEPIGLAELGRPRIDVTVRISGFFRDAFPHVVTMLDDAVQLVAGLDEAAEDNYVRAHSQADLAEHGDRRRSTTRIFGSKPGTYGAGLLQLIDSRNWRDDADLAQVYTAWGGFAYGRGLDGAAAADDMNRQYRRIAVAAKNTDTREHDIADSDDYFQYHGGMVATVRALTGQSPAAYIGDNTRPDAVRTRTLSEETTRVFRARVVDPRWINAMRRHGYKGAFEMAATVDYLFGYDATAGVMADWMYERLSAEYVLDEENRKFMAESNPWALHGMAERLLEAAGRGLWAQPEQATLDGLRAVLLETEGELEG